MSYDQEIGHRELSHARGVEIHAISTVVGSVISVSDIGWTDEIVSIFISSAGESISGGPNIRSDKNAL